MPHHRPSILPAPNLAALPTRPPDRAAVVWAGLSKLGAALALTAPLGVPLGATAHSGIVPITTEWIGPATGEWSASENWSAGAPGALDTALFGLGVTETVGVESGSAASVGRLLVRSGTLALVAESLFETNATTAMLPSIVIGDTAAFAALEFDGLGGGVFTGHFMEVASFPNGSATCAIGEGSTLDLAGALSIGPRGSGVLTLDSTTLSCLRMVLGTLASGTGSALIGGGAAFIEQTVVVGQKGNGSLEIIDSAVVTAAGGVLALDVLSEGSMIVSGPGTTVSFSETLDVGYNGVGGLEIVDGGTVAVGGTLTLGLLPGTFIFPFYPSGDGTVTVLRGGALDVGGDLFVTVGGIGKLVVGDGGRVHVSGDLNSLATFQAEFEFQIGAADPGDEPLVDVAGLITAGGTLDVTLADGYVPTVGDTVPLIAGAGINASFTISLPDPPSGVSFETMLLPTPSGEALVFSVLPDPDLNGDDIVDAADLGILLATWGTSGPGDLDGDGVVDAADLGLLLAAFD